MKNSAKCQKCSGTEIGQMKLSNTVNLDFGTYHLGDLVVPSIYICLQCGFSEIYIDSGKDLEDVCKFVATRK